jgi:diaminohydroxyphosphoribosylaminopyrimidine deaminase/5-amino-6-(5-phosphoribosylamino)uracil reductase
VAAGITRVVVGVRDPAPHASGKGLSELRRAGIDVIEGVGAAAARHVHAHYLHHVSSGRPWVTLKAALSLDGQVATASGDSQWITGQAARKDAHRLRARHHAIAVGIGTLESDDPALTVRFVTGVDPIPVLFDSALRSAALVRRRRLLREGTLVLCTARASKRDRARLEHAGVETVRVRADAGGRVSIAHALDALGQREIRSLMVEGGGTLLGAFVAADRWEQMVLYQAPRLLGEGRAVLAGFSVPRVAAGPALTVLERRRLGVDERIVLGRA